MAVAIALLAATVLSLATYTYVELPQQTRASGPVVITQAVLYNTGNNVGCLWVNITSGGGFHQGESFSLIWTISCSGYFTGVNNSSSFTVQSIESAIGPTSLRVTGSDLPVTVHAGQEGIVKVSFAPLDEPYWGPVTVNVACTSP